MAESEEKEQERRVYAVVLDSVITSREHYIYVDETTFLGQQVQRKSWSTRVNPNLHFMTGGRFVTTCYGGIGTCLKKPVVFILRSKTTNEEHYVEFLTELHKQLKPGSGKPILIYDRHTAHSSNVSWPVVTKWFRPLPQVSYSSNFNSVETVWSLAKRHYFRHRLFDRQKLTADAFKQRVAESVLAINQATVNRVLYANRAYIRQYLEQQV